MDAVFSLSSLAVLPFWAAMILLPGWRGTRRLMRSPWAVAVPAVLYAVLVAPRLGAVLPVVTRPSLETVRALLGSPAGATIAWAHFLAFDLFVGRWAYLDARERGVSGWVMAPVLYLTLMLGPVGFLAYLGVRGAHGRWRAAGAAARRGARAALAVNGPLAVVALALIPLLALTVVGVVVDPREITGAPAWLKPAKFAASITIYSLTLLWMLSRVEGRPRAVRVVGTVTAVALAVEWGIIAVQAGRGTSSHFNAETVLDGALFSIMGGFIVMVWAMNLVAAMLLARQPGVDPALAWAIRLAMLVTLLGGVAATPMLPPTPEQRASAVAGERPTRIGAHAVGVADGGAGLPVTGWSTEGGDWRVPHFFGLHALQALPLLAWLLARARRFRPGDRLALVWIGGLGYLGLFGILSAQAMRGESVAAPGGVTLAALAALGLAVAVAVSIVLFRGRPPSVTVAGWPAPRQGRETPRPPSPSPGAVPSEAAKREAFAARGWSHGAE